MSNLLAVCDVNWSSASRQPENKGTSAANNEFHELVMDEYWLAMRKDNNTELADIAVKDCIDSPLSTKVSPNYAVDSLAITLRYSFL